MFLIFFLLIFLFTLVYYIYDLGKRWEIKAMKKKIFNQKKHIEKIFLFFNIFFYYYKSVLLQLYHVIKLCFIIFTWYQYDILEDLCLIFFFCTFFLNIINFKLCGGVLPTVIVNNKRARLVYLKKRYYNWYTVNTYTHKFLV